MALPKDGAAAPNLAAVVVQKGWATPEQVQAAARKAKAERITLSQALVAQGILSEVQIRRALGGPKAGSDKPRVLDPSVVSMIKGYRIERRLGSGGMGDVFLAQQTSLDRPVALKILPAPLAKDEEFVQRFLSEARAAGKVAHENIVAAVDVGCSNGRYYFVMELVEGLTLQQKIEREGPIPEKGALEIAKQVARGLRHAHAQGLIHRDIKPANIMFTSENVAKICDFGLARRLGEEDTTLTMPGIVQSSPAYASPEQCRGRRDLDHRTDMYSLGVTLFEMLTGKRPFVAETASALFIKHATETPPSPQSLNPAISSAANQLVLRLLRKDAQQRFESYDELIEAIEGVQQSRGAPRLKLAPATPARAVPLRRFPWAGAIAGIVLLGAAVAGLLFLRQPPPKSGPESETRKKPAAESEADLLLKSVAALEKRTQDNPAEIPAVRARWKELLEQFKSTPHLAALAGRQMEFETRISERADAAATKAVAEAEGHWAANHLVEALRILKDYPSGFEGTAGAAKVAARAAEWTKTLDDRFRAEKDKAAALLAAGKHGEARTPLAAMKAIDFLRPEWPGEVEKLRAQIDAATVAATKKTEVEAPKTDPQANVTSKGAPPIFVDPARVLRNPALRADPSERSKAAAAFRGRAPRSALCRATEVFLSHDDRFWKLGGDRLKLKTEQIELDLEGQALEDGKNTVFQAINGHRIVLHKDGKVSINGGVGVTPLRVDLTRNVPTPLFKLFGDYLAALPLERADALTTAEHQGQFVGLAKKLSELGDAPKDVLFLFAMAHADELLAENVRPDPEGLRLAKLQAAKTADLWGPPATVNRLSLARILATASPVDVHRAAEPLLAGVDFPSRLLCALAAFREKELDPVGAAAAWKKLASLVPETPAAKFCDEVAERLRKSSACDACAGQGKYPCKRCAASGIAECERCKGTGRIKENDLTGLGYASTVPCPVCKQKGRFICPVCQGGKVARCEKCEGKKVRKLVAGSEFQDTLGASLCPTCSGSGSLFSRTAYPCPDCDGLGRFPQK